MVNGKWENICSRADTCALTGAAAFFSGIPKSEVLVNRPVVVLFLRFTAFGAYRV